jgi:copper chaperone NosL
MKRRLGFLLSSRLLEKFEWRKPLGGILCYVQNFIDCFPPITSNSFIVRGLSFLKLSSLFFFFFLSCSNNLPEEIVAGEHKCEFCKMGVVNQNYHSQILTKKGRRYHFDSIECMFSFWDKNKDKVEKVWVKDYLHPKDWIEIQNAKILKSEKLPSPMAANLSSYKSPKEAEDNRVLYGGVIMTQQQVMEYVKTNWEKELSGKGK